jgi:hypothetical protein
MREESIIGDPEGHRFADTQSGAVADHQGGAVLEAGDAGEILFGPEHFQVVRYRNFTEEIYKRYGTTLFAAFDIATGQVIAGHYSRRRRREFLDFMNRIVAAYPDRELHVVMDNLNTHKPKEDR